MLSCSILIMLIWVLSFFWLVEPSVCLFSQKIRSLICWFIVLFCLFFPFHQFLQWFLFILVVDWVWICFYFCLFPNLWVVSFSFCTLHNFLKCRHTAVNFFYRTAFNVSPRFCFVVFSLSFNYRNFISSLISSLTHSFFSNELFYLHESVFTKDMFGVNFKFYWSAIR